MLKALTDKVDSMQEPIGNLIREMEILRKKEKTEMLEWKTLTEGRNVIHGLISTLDTVEEGISELEDISKETSKTEREREKTWRGKNPEENTWGLPVGQQQSPACVIGTDSPHLPPLLTHEPHHWSLQRVTVFLLLAFFSMPSTSLSTFSFLAFHPIQILLGCNQRHLIPRFPQPSMISLPSGLLWALPPVPLVQDHDSNKP